MYSRTLQVGDLLTKVGSDDLITRDHQPLPTIDNITSDGLVLTMKLHSVNHAEVWITIVGLSASFHEICDYSGTEFVRELTITSDGEEIIRFAIEDDDQDDIYPINSRDNTIDLLEPITQLIQLYEPVSKVAPGYTFPIEDDDSEISGNRVVFM